MAGSRMQSLGGQEVAGQLVPGEYIPVTSELLPEVFMEHEKVLF